MCTVDASSTSTSTVRMPVPAGANLRAVSGAIGALAIILVIVLVVLCVVIAVMVLRLARKREGKTFISGMKKSTLCIRCGQFTATIMSLFSIVI